MYGYIDIINNGDIKSATKSKMLFHLQELMEDACTFPWRNVRNYHGELLSEMERNRVKWGDAPKIQRLRSKYAQTHSSGRSMENTVPCAAFNSGKCDKEDDHEGVSHVCSHCLGNNRLKGHPEHRCFSKNKSSRKLAGSQKTEGQT